jgi:hypothetical protein
MVDGGVVAINIEWRAGVRHQTEEDIDWGTETLRVYDSDGSEVLQCSSGTSDNDSSSESDGNYSLAPNHPAAAPGTFTMRQLDFVPH